MKRVVIVHGWGGNSEEGWFPWLRKELENKGFKVIIPQLPDTDNPRIYNWVPALGKATGRIDEDTYFVGHSTGVQTVIRFLETLTKDVKTGGAVFVGGYLKSLSGLEDEPDGETIKKHWLGTPIDFKKVLSHFDKSIAIFSDNDPYIPRDNWNEFKDKMNSEIIVEHKMGHFSGNDGIVELPIVLRFLLNLIK